MNTMQSMLCFEQFELKFERELTEAADEEFTERSSNVNSPSFTSTGLLGVTDVSASLPSPLVSLNFNEFS